MTNEEIMSKAQSILYDPERAGAFSREDIGILSAAIGIGRIALRAQQEQQKQQKQEQERNEPLTLDELRKMDGEPVWVVLSGKHRGWYLVSADCEAVFKQNAGCTFDEIIRNGFAYRKKPEEGTR